ncbi:hypothetical protein [Rheinheimera sp.]|uniref:hypothetical protein n=1 Tax=Rheinheimera sp. TaxID=1869214 RepID=UPI003D26A6F2
MITLTAPMVKKLDQLLAGGGGGGGGTTDLTPVLDAIAAIPGGSGSTDLTPVLNAIAAIPAPTGGNVDLTPVLNAVAAVDSKAVALQSSVAAIPGGGGGTTDLTPVLNAVAAVDSKAVALQSSVAAIPTTGGGGSAGSPIKSIQRMNISTSVAANATNQFAIAAVDPAKSSINTIASATFATASLNIALDADKVRIINTGASSANPIIKLEIIEYV